MGKLDKNILSCCISGLTILTLLDALPTIASESADDDTLVLEEIVVTATKMGSVPVQKLPQAITVLDAGTVEASGIHTLEDAQHQTPGLTVTRNGQWARIYMRGIGTNLDFIGSDPSVTVHVDGVYQARTATALEELLDVERIEVLRGPQGTLYGRNSIGGTINIVSRLPDATAASQISAEYGTNSLHRIMASASGALGSENLIGSVSLLQTEHEPYVDNVNPVGIDGLLDNNLLKAATSLQVKVGDTDKVIIRADLADADRAPPAFKTTGKTTAGEPVAVLPLLDIPENNHEINTNINNAFIDIDNWGTSAEWQKTLGANWKLTSLTAFRQLNNTGREDTDGSNLDVLMTYIDEAQIQRSEELRFNYESSRLQWVGGVFWLAEDHDSDIQVNLSSGLLQRRYLTQNKTNAYALFTQGVYELVPALNLTLGIRYSKEDKTYDNVYVPNIPGHPALGDAYQVEEDNGWEDWSPHAALDYQFNDNWLGYISVSRGFKSGGFNVTAQDYGFDPEYLWAYEIGSKWEWVEGTLRTNAALFYYDYADLQVSAFTAPGVLSISNAAEATSQGIEIENQWKITKVWELSFNYALLNAIYKEYWAPVSSVSTQLLDVSGNKLNASPENKFNIASSYYMDGKWGEWCFRIDYSWQDNQYFTAFNQRISSQGAYGLLNAQVSLASYDDLWQLHVYINNVTDTEYSTASREFAATATGVTKDINPPRTVGGKITYRF